MQNLNHLVIWQMSNLCQALESSLSDLWGRARALHQSLQVPKSCYHTCAVSGLQGHRGCTTVVLGAGTKASWRWSFMETDSRVTSWPNRNSPSVSEQRRFRGQGTACAKAERHKRVWSWLETKFAVSIDYRLFAKQGESYNQSGRSGGTVRELSHLLRSSASML